MWLLTEVVEGLGGFQAVWQFPNPISLVTLHLCHCRHRYVCIDLYLALLF